MGQAERGARLTPAAAQTSCHFPVTVQIVGALDDEQLGQLTAHVEQAVTERIAAAQRELGPALGGHGATIARPATAASPAHQHVAAPAGARHTPRASRGRVTGRAPAPPAAPGTAGGFTLAPAADILAGPVAAPGPPKAVALSPLAFSPEEIARVTARMRAAERMEYIPTFRQSEGEIDEITRRAADIAYAYRMLIWNYLPNLKDPWEVQDAQAESAFTAEDSARSRVFIDEEALERVLSLTPRTDANEKDKLQALGGWLAELLAALASLGPALAAAARLWNVDPPLVRALEAERDQLLRSVTDLRDDVRAAVRRVEGRAPAFPAAPGAAGGVVLPPGPPKAVTTSPLAFSEAEIARVTARMRAAERMEYIPTFRQSEGEIDEITRRAAKIAYAYRMLIWHYLPNLKDPWEVQDAQAESAFTAEDSARSRVFIDEEALERVLSQKGMLEPDAYEKDKLQALGGWLAELLAALACLAPALAAAARLWNVDPPLVRALEAERDQLLRSVTDLRDDVRTAVRKADEMPDMGELLVNAIVLAPFELLFPFFMTDPEHAEEIERLRQRLRPFAYRSPQQHLSAAGLEQVFSGLVDAIVLEAVSGVRAVGGVRALAGAEAVTEAGPELVRLRALFDRPAEIEAALSEIDRMSDALTRYAKTADPRESAAILARVRSGREATASLRLELREYQAATSQAAAGEPAAVAGPIPPAGQARQFTIDWPEFPPAEAAGPTPPGEPGAQVEVDPRLATRPDVARGKRPYIDDVRVPTSRIRRLDIGDFELLPGETTQRQAVARIRRLIGRKINDTPLGRVWDQARADVVGGRSLDSATRQEMLELYDKVRNRFWDLARRDADAARFVEETGFEFGGGRAPLVKVKTSGIPVQERRISLDHNLEKALGENYKKAIDADNLTFEFQNPNSNRETVQVKFGLRATSAGGE